MLIRTYKASWLCLRSPRDEAPDKTQAAVSSPPSTFTVCTHLVAMRMSEHDDDIGDGDGGAKNRLSPSYDSLIHLN